MNHLLANKSGIIFGAFDDRSIAWKAAQRIHEEGGRFVLTNTPAALRMGNTQVLADSLEVPLLPADITSLHDLDLLFQKAMQLLGGKLDFMLHAVAMSPNIRKGIAYDALDYDYWMKTLDVSALSFHKIMQTATRLDAMNEWGSVVALSYIAAQRTVPAYGDMADAKALLESIARSYGDQLGRQKRIRVNTISQSPTPTSASAGLPGFETIRNRAHQVAPLGNADACACADYIVLMLSDLSRMVTMQNLMHDGGFSSVGLH